MSFDPATIPLPALAPDMTLRDARELLRADLGDGKLAVCCTCGQDAKVYSRPLNATMLNSLAVIACSRGGLDNREIIALTKQAGGGNVSLMQHWGFVEQWSSKIWRATDFGRLFLADSMAVPSRIILYNNVCLGFDGRKMVYAHDIAGKDFLKSEVMDADAIINSDVEGGHPAGPRQSRPAAAQEAPEDYA